MDGKRRWKGEGLASIAGGASQAVLSRGRGEKIAEAPGIRDGAARDRVERTRVSMGSRNTNGVPNQTITHRACRRTSRAPSWRGQPQRQACSPWQGQPWERPRRGGRTCWPYQPWLLRDLWLWGPGRLTLFTRWSRGRLLRPQHIQSRPALVVATLPAMRQAFRTLQRKL